MRLGLSSTYEQLTFPELPTTVDPDYARVYRARGRTGDRQLRVQVEVDVASDDFLADVVNELCLKCLRMLRVDKNMVDVEKASELRASGDFADVMIRVQH